MPETYPQREAFFAIRFLRLLENAGATDEFGQTAALLLMTIVLREDERRFRGGVQFWDNELIRLCGVRTQRELAGARDKVTAAGLLHYEPGTRHRAGTYWVAIPDWLDTSAQLSVTKEIAASDGLIKASPAKDVGIRDIGVTQPCRSGGVEVTQPCRDGDLSTPSPIPVPEEEGEGAPSLETGWVEDSLAAHQAIVTEWNVVGPTKCMKLTPARRRILGVRLRDAWWRENWREGLARLPTMPFLNGQNDRGWKADFDFFLKPDTLTKIVENAYASAPTPTSRPGRLVVRGGDRFEESSVKTAEQFFGCRLAGT